MTDHARAQGTITVNPRGFGFVQLDDHPAESAFVAPPDLNPFLSDDVVEIAIESTGPNRYQAHALKLIERSRTTLFGEVTKHRGKLLLEVDPVVSNTTWSLQGKAKEGDWVVARIEGDKAVVERVVDDVDASLERLIARYRLRTTYPKTRTRRTKGAPSPVPRRDLRDVVTVTIDAPVSKDLDDAVAALPPDESGALRVLVSIADVDAMVPEGSPLDREARARATSVYLAGRVLPMLPRHLSEDALSILPDTDRDALTVELRIDREGEVTAVDLYPSTIRSNGRLSYEQVAAWMNGDEDEVAAPLLPTLQRLRAAAARLSLSRLSRGGVSLFSEEAKVELDEDAEPIAWSVRPDTPAHRLIERLMVAANEAVARWMDDRGLPAPFRIHDEPEAVRVEELVEAVRKLGFEPALGGRLTPRALAALELQYESTGQELAMDSLLRGALGPARYTVHPAPHFGLAAHRYLHFTSPIRRYADLVVHRIVKRYLAGDRDQRAGDPRIEEVCEHINHHAYLATKAERERIRMLAARYFEGRRGERLAGRVVGAEPFGLVVLLEGYGAVGTVPQKSLAGGDYEAQSHALVGEDRTFTLGERLHVEVVSTDQVLGRVELALAD